MILKIIDKHIAVPWHSLPHLVDCYVSTVKLNSDMTVLYITDATLQLDTWLCPVQSLALHGQVLLVWIVAVLVTSLSFFRLNSHSCINRKSS